LVFLGCSIKWDENIENCVALPGQAARDDGHPGSFHAPTFHLSCPHHYGIGVFPFHPFALKMNEALCSILCGEEAWHFSQQGMSIVFNKDGTGEVFDHLHAPKI
jgi:hypothetical protein